MVIFCKKETAKAFIKFPFSSSHFLFKKHNRINNMIDKHLKYAENVKDKEKSHSVPRVFIVTLQNLHSRWRV